MRQLIETVSNYLNAQSTDYAILIKGPWGCGKTHFLKNSIFPIIEKRRLKPVYVSLYGVSSSEEILRRVFLGLHPFMASKTLKRLTEIGKAVVSFTGFDLKDLKFESKTWLRLEKNLVLCFDDLERAKLDLEELLGAVNNFVEHDNLKTLIVADEDKILERKAPDEKSEPRSSSSGGERIPYTKLKEKLIGLTVQYVPEMESILSSIIDDYFADKSFKTFLSHNGQAIVQVFEKSETNNFRILRRGISFFEAVHRYLYKNHRGLIDKHGVNILVFVLSLSFEHQTGRFDQRALKELAKIASPEAFFLHLRDPFDLREKKKNKDEDHFQSFYDRYYGNQPDKFYIGPVIIDYIRDGHFDENAFSREIEDVLRRESESEEPEPIKAVLGGPYYVLTDEQFAVATNEILNQLENGILPLHLYPRVFLTFSFFSQAGLVKLTESELLGKAKQGIKTASSNTSYDKVKELWIPGQPPPREQTAEYKEIKELVEKEIGIIRESHNTKACRHLFDLLPERFDEFVKLYSDPEDGLAYLPVFKYYSSDELFQKIICLRNSSIRDFAVLIERRYGAFTEAHVQDYDNLFLLNERLQEYLGGKETALSTYLLSHLKARIQVALDGLKARLAN